MAKNIGAVSSPGWGINRADAYASAHEDIPSSELSKPSYNSFEELDGFIFYNHKMMDLYNNKKGRDIYSGNRTLTTTELAKKVYDSRSSFVYLYSY
nr:hypothetical protein [Fusibacter sp. 3D3]